MTDDAAVVRIELRPLDRVIEARPGTVLREVLHAHGVEFPCGGRARCGRCRVQVVEGSLGLTAEQAGVLSSGDLAAGWRLACRAPVEGDAVLRLAAWETPVLADDTPLLFSPRPGLGIAVDLGTTTIVGQLVDFVTGRVLGVATALNPQAAYGADVMTRLEHAREPAGRARLASLAREGLSDLLGRLMAAGRAAGAAGAVVDVVIVGNTVMRGLLLDLDLDSLTRAPFEVDDLGPQTRTASALGWNLDGDPPVRFLPCLGSFVGADALAGVLATRLHENERLAALVDLGTNGEVVVGTRERMLCASTAAGPAFEGGAVTMGMQAASGAISEVTVDDGRLRCRVVGDAAPRGVCGSGLVDAVAAGLDLGLVAPNGRLARPGEGLRLAGPVVLRQADVRALQLAKAAVAAALRLVLRRFDAAPADLEALWLAGAFGNYVRPESARRIGLFDLPDARVQPAGNTALLGAKIALFGGPVRASDGVFDDLRSRVGHVPLAADPGFETVFVEQMRFPEPTRE